MYFAVYFPSALPTTRLSISTAALPSAPSPTTRPAVYKTPGRGSKSRFRDKLGGLLEEDGEEVLSISRCPQLNRTDDEPGLWAVLGREEFSLWSIRASSQPRSPAEYPKLISIDCSPKLCSPSCTAPPRHSARTAPTRASCSCRPPGWSSQPRPDTTCSTPSAELLRLADERVGRFMSFLAGRGGLQPGREDLVRGCRCRGW